jgi:hypothetical protein
VRRRLGPRFGAEAGLIAASAALAALLEVDWPGIVATVFGTWLAIAVFEVVWARAHPAAAETAAAAPAVPAQPRAAQRPVRASGPGEGVRGDRELPPTDHRGVSVETPPPPSPPVEHPRPQATPGAPRSWNLWELERAARDLAGTDAVADEERQYMLLYLRDFASADGKLPIDFDPLVREVFGEQLVTAS